MVVTASSPVAPAAPAAWHTRRARLRAAGSCAALLLTAFAVGGCAGDGGTGHVAIGGVGPSPDSTAGSADTPPDGRVVMVPLDGSPPRGAPATSAERALLVTAFDCCGDDPDADPVPASAAAGRG